MTQYKITAPVAGFNGTVANVVFSQGQALLTVDPDAERTDGATSLPQPNRALAYFQRKGYTVEKVESAEDAKLDKDTAAPGTPASRAVAPEAVAGSGVKAPEPTQPAPVGSEELATQSAAKNAGGEGDKPKPPNKSASKADFVEYATKYDGMAAVDANDMTRDQLVAKYHKEDAK
jgi:hypothetical protein